MLQILLLSSVLFAAIAVLYASHRAGHKLFVRISAVFALVSALILAGLAWELAHPPAPADPETIVIVIDEANPLERGYRLSGSIRNTGDIPVSEISAVITLADCSSDPCAVLGEQPLKLLMHIPAGADYPLAHVVELPGVIAQRPQWSVRVTAARVSEAR